MTDPRGTQWTDAELTALHRDYPLRGVAGVRLHVPHRSPLSIRLKAHRLGLKRRKLTLDDINARVAQVAA